MKITLNFRNGRLVTRDDGQALKAIIGKTRDDFNPSEKRDDIGRWTSTGSSDGRKFEAYNTDYRGGQGVYDPAYFDKARDPLIDDKGIEVGWKHRMARNSWRSRTP